jgi:hypothetical protein
MAIVAYERIQQMTVESLLDWAGQIRATLFEILPLDNLP